MFRWKPRIVNACWLLFDKDEESPSQEFFKRRGYHWSSLIRVEDCKFDTLNMASEEFKLILFHKRVLSSKVQMDWWIRRMRLCCLLDVDINTLRGKR